jgi:HSP20 family protein
MDDGDALTVVADLPGVEKADLDITYRDGILTLAADSTSDTADESDEYVMRERRHTSFERNIRLPAPVDTTETSATYINGVLTISLPKLDAEDDATRIDIE